MIRFNEKLPAFASASSKGLTKLEYGAINVFSAMIANPGRKEDWTDEEAATVAVGLTRILLEQCDAIDRHDEILDKKESHSEEILK